MFFFFPPLFFNKACFVRKPLPSASAFRLAANCLLVDDIFHELPHSPTLLQLHADDVTQHSLPAAFGRSGCAPPALSPGRCDPSPSGRNLRKFATAEAAPVLRALAGPRLLFAA